MSSKDSSSIEALSEIHHNPSNNWFPSVRLKSSTSGTDNKMIMNNSEHSPMGGTAHRLNTKYNSSSTVTSKSPMTSSLSCSSPGALRLLAPTFKLTSILSHVILLSLLSVFLSLSLTSTSGLVSAMPARIGVSTSEKGVFWPFEIDNNAINNNIEQNDDSSLYSGQNYIYRAAEKQQQKSQVGSILNWPSSQGGAHLNHAYHNPHRSRTSGAHSIHSQASWTVLLLVSTLLLLILV